ncbi:MAG: DUF928 domain-containing protein [Leptolyngbya sp. Prado105]|jgi:hypothetical protein|nr:DUF928 domain-containing protein [Leptolyngbya sp. Prado105]
MNFKLSHIAVSLSLLTVVSLSSHFANAQPRIRFSPPPPPDTGTPSDRGTGAGARGCDQEFPGLKVLVPSPRSNDQWGLTVSDRPTIWVNIPTGVEAGTLVEWKLRNSNNKVIYRTTARLPKTNPGVVSFAIPNSVAPLAVSTYQWDLALYCGSANDNPTSQDEITLDLPLVRKGRIQRVAPTAALQQGLAGAKTSLDRAKLYAKYGIWYDALTTLGTEIRATQDKSTLEAWNELLKQQKLESKTATTVTPCCQLEKLTR